jgi:hypothetical protein
MNILRDMLFVIRWWSLCPEAVTGVAEDGVETSRTAVAPRCGATRDEPASPLLFFTHLKQTAGALATPLLSFCPLF